MEIKPGIKPTPRFETLDADISRNVYDLLWDRRVRPGTLAVATGLSPNTILRRLHGGTQWRVFELERVAAFFGVTVDSLKLPRRDSNLQPLDNPHESGEPVAA
jgi:hypothetical protein